MTYSLTLSKRGAAIVLGGSGGIGEVISRTMAQAGSAVAVTYLTNESKAQQLKAEFAAIGVQASAHSIDLRDTQAAIQTIREIAELHGGIHTLVYASGPRHRLAAPGDLLPSELLDVLATEVAGFHAGIVAALPFLRLSQGSIVACTSMTPQRVFPQSLLSIVPKSALESLVRQVAHEEAQNLVRANIVGVGSLNVGMGARGGPRSNIDGIPPERMAQMDRLIPLGRRGTGEELASAALYFASDQASFITGQTIVVDGGQTL
jgi:3-oxoacyl-[acyl-carrier protein] reductase